MQQALTQLHASSMEHYSHHCCSIIQTTVGERAWPTCSCLLSILNLYLNSSASWASSHARKSAVRQYARRKMWCDSTSLR